MSCNLEGLVFKRVLYLHVRNFDDLFEILTSKFSNQSDIIMIINLDKRANFPLKKQYYNFHKPNILWHEGSASATHAGVQSLYLGVIYGS